jgi:hypothetical protein
MLQYRFTRENGAYVVTTPAAAGAWRKLDGSVSTHAGGAVACVQLHGADALLAEDVREAWREWWHSVYC